MAQHSSRISSAGNTTTFAKSITGPGLTEKLSISNTIGGTGIVVNNVNAPTSIGAGGAIEVLGVSNKALVSASTQVAATLNWSQNFTGRPILTNGVNSLTISGTDAQSSPQTGSSSYQIAIPGAASTTTATDANGNITNDGTNTYLWDAENRLIQITYPGSGPLCL